MTALEQYATKYETVRMERRGGILQLTVHTGGDTLQWGEVAHRELPQAFLDVGRDPANEVVILTGTGAGFSGPKATRAFGHGRSAREWDKLYWEGKHLLHNLLDIEVPVISAINGPALRHSEIPLLSDIVLASNDTTFQDSAHFMNGLVPGDGMHVVYPLLMGLNRGRYFLLTGQTLTAQQAHEFGLVAEVLPRAELLPRAWALAEQLLEQPLLVRRYTRVVLTQHIKGLLHDLLGYGLALEGLGSTAEVP